MIFVKNQQKKKGRKNNMAKFNIYHRRDGRWEGRISRGKKSNGRRCFQYIFAKTKKQVIEKMENIYQKEKNSTSSSKTFREIYDEWFCCIKYNIKESTASNYRMKEEKHILPNFGKQAMGDIVQNDIYSLIEEKKREKQELTKQEIEYFVKEYVEGEIADYQAAALVMAIFLNEMTKQETTNLTIAMAHSGEILDLSKLNKTIVDKHSTGGVGDKVSICLLPLVASLGVPVAKMSGRGLGFTGGTVDKMQSIPGYKTDIDINSFIKNVENVGISMISQTMNLAPADKKLYALRDSIACVESIPLIASSIMSKKIASGAEKIVLDVTVGKGAFMKTMENAELLANEMIEIGKLANRETVCVLTNMNEPLGCAVGNNLEVIEAIKFLKGDMPEDLRQVVLELGAYMIKLAGLGEDLEENKNRMLENISNGKALNKFIEMVKKQEGDISYLEDTNKFEKAKIIEPIIAKQDGYIQEMNAEEIGKVACGLGAGRVRKEDSIDYTVGIILNKKVADKVTMGEVLGYIHANSQEKYKEAERKLAEIIKISDNKIEKEPTIFGICK